MNAFMNNHNKVLLRAWRHRSLNSKPSYYKYSSLSSQYRHGTKLLPKIDIYSVSGCFNTIQLPYSQNTLFNVRCISASPVTFEKSSSKIEDVVKNLKETEKVKKESADTATETSGTSQQLTVSKVESSVAVKKTLMQRIWAEMVHYYHGFRLLFIDINVSRKLLWKVLNGDSLSRREHRLLVRTTSDLFRLVPFSVFIIVPFMELLLPLAIKLFPGMLPSTFQSSSDEDKKIKQNLKVKIEMAKFLQKTLDDMTVQHKNHRSEAAKEFSEFFQRVRTSGDLATNEEIIKFSKLFEDEITLDSLSRQQLLALCRVLEANTLGTTNLLRFQLRMKLRSLAADDRMIQKEGVDMLNLEELQSACRARGMRAYGITEERLKAQLQEWINLSLNEKVPPSLLLLSRALMMPEHIEVGEKLKATLAQLPETVGTQTKSRIGEMEGKIDNKTKIEIIKEEERKIKEEQEEEQEIERENRAKEILDDKAPIITADTIVSSEKILVDKAPEEKPTVSAEKELSTEDLKVIGDALETISKEKSLLLEKEELKDIKEEIAEYQEDVQELESMVEQERAEKVEFKESRAAKLLLRKVNSMINNLDKVLEDLESKEKEIKVLIQEPAEITEAVEAVIEEENKRKNELVRIDEMMNAIRKIKKVSNESVLQQIEKILGRMDDDRDGSLKVEDVMKVIETVGKENVNLNEKQLHEILDLIDKEEILEMENKIEKALKKEQEQKKLVKSEKDDFVETESSFLLKDKAPELNDTSSPGEEKHVDEKIKQAVEIQSEQILSQTAKQPPLAPASDIKSKTVPKDKTV